MVTTFTYRPSLVKIDARNFELSWQQTPSARSSVRPPHTQRQDRLQYTAPQLASAQCNHGRVLCVGYDYDSTFLHCLQTGTGKMRVAKLRVGILRVGSASETCEYLGKVQDE